MNGVYIPSIYKLKSFKKNYMYDFSEEYEREFYNLNYLLKRRKIYIIDDILKSAIKNEISDIHEFRIFLKKYDSKKLYKRLEKPKVKINKLENFKE